MNWNKIVDGFGKTDWEVVRVASDRFDLIVQESLTRPKKEWNGDAKE